MDNGRARLRAATPAGAHDLAVLIDRVGEGIPSWRWGWQAGPGQDPIDSGAAPCGQRLTPNGWHRGRSNGTGVRT
jgi:hypothetical protein